MEVKLVTNSKEETVELGKFVAKYLFPNSVLTLTGDLGAGKTTFTKGVGSGLGIKEEINSPTFNILKCYFNKPLSLYHIDAYRLEGVAKEQKNIGLEEVIEGEGVCLIEWPMYISEFIPSDHLNINIHLVKEDIREFKFSSDSELFSKLLLDLKEKYHD